MTLNFDRWLLSKAVVVVTGASSGIGAAIAERLVKTGLTVIGIARRVQRVEELSEKLSGEKGKLVPLKTDVSKQDEVVKAFEWIQNNIGPVHILINNAAVSNSTKEGSLLDGSYEKWKNVFDTNVLGLSIATREAVKQMRTNNINGHIIHINSVYGHKVPNSNSVAFYSASKFGVTALTEALRNELREAKTKIKITSISPGLVDTELMITDPKLLEETRAKWKNFPILQPEDIAEAVVYVLSTPEHVQVHELTIKPVGEPF